MFNIRRPIAAACMSLLCLLLFVGGCSKDADNPAAEADQEAKEASEFAVSVKVGQHFPHFFRGGSNVDLGNQFAGKHGGMLAGWGEWGQQPWLIPVRPEPVEGWG